MEAMTVLLTDQKSSLVETVSFGIELQKILDCRYINPCGKKVMELGFGKGTIMPFLGDKFGDKVCRMDLSDWNARNQKINAGLVQGELQGLPIAKDSVDVVVSMDVFEEEFDLLRALGEIERVLIDGGESLLIISDEHFQDGKLKMKTTLEIVGSMMLAIPEGTNCSWVVTLRKKSRPIPLLRIGT